MLALVRSYTLCVQDIVCKKNNIRTGQKEMSEMYNLSLIGQLKLLFHFI